MKRRLFVVDDDSSVRESLKKVLEESGYEVLLAADGAEALSRLAAEPMDLLILDVNMPGRDGWDVLEDVSEDHPLLPVVMITGMYDELDTTQIPGVRALLKKPLEVPLLLNTVELLLAETPEQRLSRYKMSFEQAECFQNRPERMAGDTRWTSRWNRNQ